MLARSGDGGSAAGIVSAAPAAAGWAHLPNWLIAALVFALFGVLPAVAHLADVPDETEALAITAEAVADLGREGPDLALGGPVR